MNLAPESVVPLPPIIIADGDPDDLFFALRLVKGTGTRHPVMTFDDGSGVADYLSRAWLRGRPRSPELPRLLFLDLEMARLDGFAFLQWLSGHDALSAIHVVVLSGSDRPQDVERAKALGAKRYLAKHPGTTTFARIIAHVYGNSAIPQDSLRNGSCGDAGLRGRVLESGWNRLQGARPGG